MSVMMDTWLTMHKKTYWEKKLALEDQIWRRRLNVEKAAIFEIV